MRVAIDTNGTYTTQAGVARYIHGLIRGIHSLDRRDVEIIEFAWKVANLEYRQPRRALRTAYRELVWRRFVAPGLLERERADLLHSTMGCLVDPPRGVPNVATLHDAAVFRFPDRFRAWQGWSGRRRLQRLAAADRVICISRFSADEGIQLLNLDPRKIEVIHNGCDFHPDEPSPVEEQPRFPVPPEFFLFVGSLEPGKNLALLRESYRQAEAEGRRLPPLLIVGARWPGVASEGQPPGDWHYLGRQPDSVLVHLYRRALALVFPSRYEGFGLPVAEAMALGCPVLCSPVASLKEVGEGAAMFADLDPGAYRVSMRQLAGDESLRRDMSARGLGCASKFSWKQCAARTVEVYQDALR